MTKRIHWDKWPPRRRAYLEEKQAGTNPAPTAPERGRSPRNSPTIRTDQTIADPNTKRKNKMPRMIVPIDPDYIERHDPNHPVSGQVWSTTFVSHITKRVTAVDVVTFAGSRTWKIRVRPELSDGSIMTSFGNQVQFARVADAIAYADGWFQRAGMAPLRPWTGQAAAPIAAAGRQLAAEVRA